MERYNEARIRAIYEVKQMSDQQSPELQANTSSQGGFVSRIKDAIRSYATTKGHPTTVPQEYTEFVPNIKIDSIHDAKRVAVAAVASISIGPDINNKGIETPPVPTPVERLAQLENELSEFRITDEVKTRPNSTELPAQQNGASEMQSQQESPVEQETLPFTSFLRLTTANENGVVNLLETQQLAPGAIDTLSNVLNNANTQVLQFTNERNLAVPPSVNVIVSGFITPEGQATPTPMPEGGITPYSTYFKAGEQFVGFLSTTNGELLYPDFNALVTQLNNNALPNGGEFSPLATNMTPEGILQFWDVNSRVLAGEILPDGRTVTYGSYIDQVTFRPAESAPSAPNWEGKLIQNRSGEGSEQTFQPGAMKTEIFEQVRIIGNINSVYQNNEGVWMANVSSGNETFSLILGTETRGVPVSELLVTQDGNPYQDASENARIFDTMQVISFLQQNPGVPFMMDYSDQFLPQLQEARNSLDSFDQDTKDFINRFFESDTDELIASISQIAPGQRYSGPLSGKTLVIGEVWLPISFSSGQTA